MNKRLFLYSAFFFVALLLYESWVSQFSSVDNTNNTMNEVPLTNDADESPANTKDVQQPKPKSKVYENVEVTTENLKLKIDLESGAVIFAELLNYKNEFSPDSANVVIIDRDSSNYIASANLQDSDGNDTGNIAAIISTYAGIEEGSNAAAGGVGAAGRRSLHVATTAVYAALQRNALPAGVATTTARSIAAVNTAGA